MITVSSLRSRPSPCKNDKAARKEGFAVLDLTEAEQGLCPRGTIHERIASISASKIHWRGCPRSRPPRDGTTLNQFIVSAVAEKLAVLKTADCFAGARSQEKVRLDFIDRRPVHGPWADAMTATGTRVRSFPRVRCGRSDSRTKPWEAAPSNAHHAAASCRPRRQP
jgi:hypothetical protein